ncbi:cobinamide kinase / cobinamide phosphate guanyltransferase family protein [Mycobacterium xenopi 4042]|uniref:Cobinamide kinase / cobinamide phosphate guanyltransferase family protein n=1 Tax=Mycobacterium xenopi 4042 TaxID=1299334 RepID=X8DCZ8_MYCXE|nr:cobinamide kinase / cobinamide phosphate guanyltransferase family protein [Mycobacterium xenopi 4042]
MRQSPDIPTLVDDIGGWLTATLDRERAWNAGSVVVDVEEVVAAVRVFRAPLVLVTSEVGLSLVPTTASAAASWTSWVRSTSGWPRCATGWCCW